MGPWWPISSNYFGSLPTALFHKHSHSVFGILYLCYTRSDTDFPGRLLINPELCQCPQRRSCQLQLFWYLEQIVCFCCINCSWASYHTFNVIVHKCTRYITHITLNVSQSGSAVVSQLGFERGSLIWWAGSLPTKPSRPAYEPLLKKILCWCPAWVQLIHKPHSK